MCKSKDCVMYLVEYPSSFDGGLEGQALYCGVSVQLNVFSGSVHQVEEPVGALVLPRPLIPNQQQVLTCEQSTFIRPLFIGHSQLSV